MKSIAEIRKNISPPAGGEKTRKTERGELLRFFQRHLNYARKQDGHTAITMSRMGYILEQIPTRDLYYLQSVCSKAKNFGKKFWWEIDPKKHLAENRAPF